MKLVEEALRAGRSRPLAAAADASPPPRLLLLGAGGALGSAVLEQLLGGSAFGEIAVGVTGPLQVALQGLVPLPVGDLAALRTRADTAVLVFDLARHANGREQALFRPEPGQLLPLAQALRASGVRRLVLLLPHAPARLPQALKQGLANLDEQGVAALGFEQLLLVRPAQPQVHVGAGSFLARVAHAVLSQLHWMVPTPDLPVRASKVAELTRELVRQLPAARPGTRVAPPEFVWAAAQTGNPGPLVAQWLAEGRWSAPRVVAWKG